MSARPDAADIVRALGGKWNGSSGMCRCPAHDDSTPSLSVTQNADGKVLLHCFGGCPNDDVIDALRRRGLWPDQSDRGAAGESGQPAGARAKANGAGKTMTSVFQYCDDGGRVLYEVVRVDRPDGGKLIYQRRVNADGSTTPSMKGIDLVPYRLPELIAGIAAGATVFIVEGEPKVDLLAGWGLTATCNSGGARKWKAEFVKFFEGRNVQVVILPDNDRPGHAHACQVAENLLPAGTAIKIVELPGLAPREDVIEWAERGGTKAALLALAAATPMLGSGAKKIEDIAEHKSRHAKKVRPLRRTLHGIIMPPGAPPAPKHKRGIDLWCARQEYNDLGNANRFIVRHGHDFLWTEADGWLVWDRRRWTAEGGEVALKRAAQATADAMHDEAECLIARGQVVGETEKEFKKVIDKAFKWCTTSSNVRRLAAMREAVQHQLAKSSDKFDTNHFLFNVANGTLELGQMQSDGTVPVRFRPHARSDLITKVSPVAYDPHATACPLWRAFLDLFLPNKSLQLFLQTFFGYCLTGSIKEQVLVMLHGTGANGKTTLLETVAWVMGDYSRFIPIRSLIEAKIDRDGGAPSPDLARLRGARLVRSAEPKRGAPLDESLVKQLTGGEKVTARHLHREFFEYLPSYKLAISFNRLPRISGTDDGIWRRIGLVPFDVKLERIQQDKEFPARLRGEGSAILNWLLDGYRIWRERGLALPAEVVRATAAWRAKSDPVGPFVASACVVTGQADQRARTGELWRAYCAWCVRNGAKPVSQTALGTYIGELKGIQKDHDRRGWFYTGLQIVDQTLLADRAGEQSDVEQRNEDEDQ